MLWRFNWASKHTTCITTTHANIYGKFQDYILEVNA